ncbi:hypothetical protein Poly51_19890 [Rubripirellula tenax]|uniref:Uncharacterized protein n=1 Tax=Rubripirellula tenax TaxID=2528015 RepID=A0A5C6FBR8_9BACT|nr:hypothetical protein [Rubripirellula tenax]TWU59203.1 hypothetical protein Poly51_19890 [Rubripirellula tenax]
MTSNPFAPAASVDDEIGVCGDARLIRSGFLFRIIEFETPRKCGLRYSGWWFLQRVWVDDHKVWSKVSWLNLSRNIEFRLPADRFPDESLVRIEIVFRPGLVIRRFRVWMDEQLAFDQIS